MITDAGVLKVGDFGQARPLVATEGEKSDFSHQISTRWYPVSYTHLTLPTILRV